MLLTQLTTFLLFLMDFLLLPGLANFVRAFMRDGYQRLVNQYAKSFEDYFCLLTFQVVA